jgi:hypothetical protein
MNTTISTQNRKTIIESRTDSTDYTGIKIQSSTSGQPYIARNFLDGKQIGGSTITEGQYQNLLAAAKKNGWTIE